MSALRDELASGWPGILAAALAAASGAWLTGLGDKAAGAFHLSSGPVLTATADVLFESNQYALTTPVTTTADRVTLQGSGFLRYRGDVAVGPGDVTARGPAVVQVRGPPVVGAVSAAQPAQGSGRVEYAGHALAVVDLQALTDDELSPPIRHNRERRRLAQLEKILADHSIDPCREPRINGAEHEPSL